MSEDAKMTDREIKFEAVLRKIAFTGSDCPAVQEEASFYRHQLHYCIGSAARALAAPADPGDDAERELTLLKKERDENERDAERYRYLRNPRNGFPDDPDHLDRALDAARSAEKENE